jgi:hypothetical protein
VEDALSDHGIRTAQLERRPADLGEIVEGALLGIPRPMVLRRDATACPPSNRAVIESRRLAATVDPAAELN